MSNDFKLGLLIDGDKNVSYKVASIIQVVNILFLILALNF